MGRGWYGGCVSGVGVGVCASVWGFGFLRLVELEGGEGGVISEDVVDPVKELWECGSLCGVSGESRLGCGGVPGERGKRFVGWGGEGWGFVVCLAEGRAVGRSDGDVGLPGHRLTSADVNGVEVRRE